MQDKLKKLFDSISFKEESYFDKASLDKVIVYDNNKIWKFIIEVDSILPCDIYFELFNKLKDTFNKVDDIILTIKAKNITYSKINDYFKVIIDELVKLNVRYKVFSDRELELNDDDIYFSVFNNVEKINMIAKINYINDKLHE